MSRPRGSSGDDDACEIGVDCALVSDAVGANRTGNRTVVNFDPPTTGGNSTCSDGLFDELSGSARTCQAGCCVDGACVCHEGYVGAQCDAQLRCGAAVSATDAAWDLGACQTVVLPDARRAVCSCSDLEFVAVLAHRLRPASALLDALDGGWPHDLRDALRGLSATGWLWLCALSATYVVLTCGAWVLDQRTCYTTAVPRWAEPGSQGFPLWRQTVYFARTQLQLLRPMHVVPGRTAYTRLQCVHSVAVAAALNCVGSLLFIQTQQCSVLATYAAGAVGGLTCSFPALLARLAFLRTRDARTTRSCNVRVAEREELFLLAGSMAEARLPSPVQAARILRERISQRSSTRRSVEHVGRGRHVASSEASPALIRGNEPTTAGADPGRATGGFMRQSWAGQRTAPGSSFSSIVSEQTRLSEVGSGALESHPSSRAAPPALCSVQLWPSQLTLRPDGITLGFHVPGAGGHVPGVGGRGPPDALCVPAVGAGVPFGAVCSREPRFRVQYAEAALAAHGHTITQADVRALEAVAKPVAKGDGPTQAAREEIMRRQLRARQHATRPPLSRWGCSVPLAVVWSFNALCLAAGCLFLLTLLLVAVPRSAELRGLSEKDAWSRAHEAMTFGMLNTFVIIDSLKIVVLVATGPGVTSLIVRIRQPRVRAIVRAVVQMVHLPIALVCP